MIELKIESGIELENVADMMSKFVRDKLAIYARTMGGEIQFAKPKEQVQIVNVSVFDESILHE